MSEFDAEPRGTRAPSSRGESQEWIGCRRANVERIFDDAARARIVLRPITRRIRQPDLS